MYIGRSLHSEFLRPFKQILQENMSPMSLGETPTNGLISRLTNPYVAVGSVARAFKSPIVRNHGAPNTIYCYEYR